MSRPYLAGWSSRRSDSSFVIRYERTLRAINNALMLSSRCVLRRPRVASRFFCDTRRRRPSDVVHLNISRCRLSTLLICPNCIDAGRDSTCTVGETGTGRSERAHPSSEAHVLKELLIYVKFTNFGSYM